MTACYTCRHNAMQPSTLPPRESIHDDGLWRVAHSFNSALAGWLVVVARRHIASLSELTPDEAAALGPLLRALSLALEGTLSAAKTYVIFLAESEGFSHLHIHVIPRHPDLPADRRGPAIFAYQTRPESEWIPAPDMDTLALQLRPQILAALAAEQHE